MRKILLLLLIVVSGYVNVLYGQGNNRHNIVPVETERIFFEGEQKFTYQVKDDVFVSVGYNSQSNGEYIFDMTIDNQSEDTLEFDPGEIQLFTYSQDSLTEIRLHYAQDPELILDSIDYTIDKKKSRIRNTTFLSILIGAAYITTEIAGFKGSIDFDAMEVIRFSHDVAQIGLDIAREDAGEKIYDLEYAGDYWLNGTLQHCFVLPHTFETGKIHFKVPQSKIIEIFVPIDYRVYRYKFQDVAIHSNDPD